MGLGCFVFLGTSSEEKSSPGNFTCCTKLTQTRLVYLPDVME